MLFEMYGSIETHNWMKMVQSINKINDSQGLYGDNMIQII